MYSLIREEDDCEHVYLQLTPSSRFLVGKLPVAQLRKKFPAFYATQGSSLRSQPVSKYSYQKFECTSFLCVLYVLPISSLS
jgi:hypothetical protein